MLVIGAASGSAGLRWRGRRHDDNGPGAAHGDGVDTLFRAVFEALHDGEQVAVGFSAPLAARDDAHDPTDDDPTGDDPTGDDPTGDDPTGDDPTAMTRPAMTRPAMTRPAMTRPAMTRPAMTRPAMTRPTMSRPTSWP